MPRITLRALAAASQAVAASQRGIATCARLRSREASFPPSPPPKEPQDEFEDFEAQFAERYKPSQPTAPPNVFDNIINPSKTDGRHAPPPVPVPSFAPRRAFSVSENTNRSYFLGHHVSALSSMRSVLGRISLVLEARDFRVPLSSINPELDRALAGRPRIIVYTKCDLADDSGRDRRLLKHWHGVNRHSFETIFHADKGGAGRGRAAAAQRSTEKLLDAIKELRHQTEDNGPLGTRALIVGMPNAGKSTLLNVLREEGMSGRVMPGDKGSRTVLRDGRRMTVHKKAARTAPNPGVTRKMSGPVRILPRRSSTEGTEAGGEGDYEDDQGVLVLDTPGVFVPYVSDATDMLKLALVGTIKDGIVNDEIVADYLLYRLNLIDPGIYSKFSEPTNDVIFWLERIAKRTGKLAKGGSLRTEAAAAWIIQQWRTGRLGRFMLDEVTPETLAKAQRRIQQPPNLTIREAKIKLAMEKKERAATLNAEDGF